MNKDFPNFILTTTSPKFMQNNAEGKGFLNLNFRIQFITLLSQHLQKQLFTINNSFYRKKCFTILIMVFFFWKLSGYCFYGNFENVIIILRKGPVLSSLDAVWAFWTPQELFIKGMVFEAIIVCYALSLIFFLVLIFFLIIQATKFRSNSLLEISISQSLSIYFYVFFPFVTEFCFLPFSCSDGKLSYLLKVERIDKNPNYKCESDDYLILQGLAIPIMIWNCFIVFFLHPRINCSLQGDRSDYLSKYNTGLEALLGIVITFQAALQVFAADLDSSGLLIFSFMLGVCYGYLSIKHIACLPYKSLVINKCFTVFFNIMLYKYTLRCITHIIDLKGKFNSGFEAYSLIAVGPIIARLTTLAIDRKIEKLLSLSQNELDNPFLIIHYVEFLQKLLSTEDLESKKETIQLSESELRLKGIFKNHIMNCSDPTCPCRDSEISDSHEVLFRTTTRLIKNIYVSGIEKFPSNKMLLLFYANFSLQIEKLPVRTYHLLNKVGLDFMAEEAILGMNIMERLKRFVENEWSKQRENPQNDHAFDPRELLLCEKLENELRELVKSGVDMLINFWGELYKQDQDMSVILSISNRLNGSIKLVREVDKNLESFDERMALFISRLHVYIDLFSYIIQNDLQKGFQFVNKQNMIERGVFRRKFINQHLYVSTQLEKDLAALEEDKIMILKMSIHEKNLGCIIDVTQNCKGILGVKRDQLIDKPIEKIMPNLFAEVHPKLLQQFVEEGYSVHIGFSRKVFAINSNGYCIPVSIRYNYEPNLVNGFNLVAMIHLIRPSLAKDKCLKRHYIITNHAGQIDSFTEELGYLLGLKKNHEKSRKKIFEVCSKFKKIYKALNESAFAKDALERYEEISVLTDDDTTTITSPKVNTINKLEKYLEKIREKGYLLKLTPLTRSNYNYEEIQSEKEEIEFMVKIEDKRVFKKIIRIIELQEVLASSFPSQSNTGSLPALYQNAQPSLIVTGPDDNVKSVIFPIPKEGHDTSLRTLDSIEGQSKEFMIEDEGDDEDYQRRAPDAIEVVEGAKTLHHDQERRIHQKRPPPKVRAQVDKFQKIFIEEEEVIEDIEDGRLGELDGEMVQEGDVLVERGDSYDFEGMSDKNHGNFGQNHWKFEQNNQNFYRKKWNFDRNNINPQAEFEDNLEEMNLNKGTIAQSPSNIEESISNKNSQFNIINKFQNNDQINKRNSLNKSSKKELIDRKISINYSGNAIAGLENAKSEIGRRENDAMRIENFIRTDFNKRIERLEKSSVQYMEQSGSIQFLLKNYRLLQQVIKSAPLTLELKILKFSITLFTLLFFALTIVNSFTVNAVFENLRRYDITINNLDLATFNMVQLQRSATIIKGVNFDKTFPKLFNEDPLFDVTRAKAMPANIAGMNENLNKFNDYLLALNVDIPTSYQYQTSIWVKIINGQKVLQNYTLFSALQLIKNSAFSISRLANYLRYVKTDDIELLTDNIMNNLLVAMEDLSGRLRTKLDELIKKDWQTIQVVFGCNIGNVTFFILLFLFILFKQNKRMEQVSSLLSTLNDEQIEENIERLRNLRLIYFGEASRHGSMKERTTLSAKPAALSGKKRFTKTPIFRKFNSNMLVLFFYLIFFCLAPLISNLIAEFSFFSGSFNRQLNSYNKITIISRDRLLQKTFLVIDLEMIVSRSQTKIRNNNIEDEIFNGILDIGNIGWFYDAFFKDDMMDPDFAEIISDRMCATVNSTFCARVPSILNKGYMETRGSKLSYVKRTLEIWIQKNRTREAAIQLLNDPLTVYIYNIDVVETQVTNWILTALRNKYALMINGVLNHYYIYLIINILILMFVSLTLWLGVYRHFLQKYIRVMSMFSLINYEYVKENKFLSTFLNKLARRSNRFSFKGL